MKRRGAAASLQGESQPLPRHVMAPVFFFNLRIPLLDLIPSRPISIGVPEWFSLFEKRILNCWTPGETIQPGKKGFDR
jgi:hypothetical protein